VSGRVVVGTSSWADPGFVEEWYPPGLPARDRLAWYAERFEAVEVNATFDVPVVRMMFDDNRGGDAPRAAERMCALPGQAAATA
jgi:hypothetical protein